MRFRLHCSAAIRRNLIASSDSAAGRCHPPTAWPCCAELHHGPLGISERISFLLHQWSQRDLREMKDGCPLMSLVGLNNRYYRPICNTGRSISIKERVSCGKLKAKTPKVLKATILEKAGGHRGTQRYEQSGKHPVMKHAFCSAHRSFTHRIAP